MRVMVLAKATEDSEKGVLPTAEAFEAMDRFTEELRGSVAARIEVMRQLIASDRWSLAILAFPELDRWGHAMRRRAAAGDEQASAALGGMLEAIDAFVGELRRAHPAARMLALSAHGVAAVDRTLNIEAWLVEGGYLAGEGATLVTGGSGEGTLDLQGMKLAIGLIGNFMLGALMTLGIGLYAPCMILVGMLGMNAATAFPIMMGSCAFLMPVASSRFVQKQAYSLRPALGLAIGGIPGVLLAAYIFTSLPIYWVRWLVVVVVIIAATMMLRSAAKGE